MGPAPQTEGAPPQEFRLRAATRNLAGLGDPLVGVALVLAFFELLSRTETLPSRWLPPISLIFRTFWHMLGTGRFWSAVGDTLESWALSILIICAIAIPVGMLMGASTLVYRAMRPIVEFLRPIPSVSLIPFAVFVLGRTLEMKLFLVVFGAIWPMLIQTMYAVRDVDQAAIDVARSFGLGRFARLYRIVLPSMVPYLATGLRITASLALLINVVTELVGGGSGLGDEISRADQGGSLERMYALMLAIGLLGWGINIVLAAVERRVLHWHPRLRDAAA